MHMQVPPKHTELDNRSVPWRVQETSGVASLRQFMHAILLYTLPIMILMILLQLFIIMFLLLTLFISHAFVEDSPDEDMATSGYGAVVGTSNAHASESQ